jgi:pyruvate dehydrogenase E1 component alpha subunit
MVEKLTRDQSVAILERMLLMRRFEEMVVRLFEEKHFFCHYHLYIGQEATGAAAIEALEPGDLTLTTHRNHGHVVGRGADPGKALAEILGRTDGFSKGRGGTLHMTDRSVGFLSTSAVVGSVVGLAAGAAYAFKQARKGNVAIGFFGDAALEEGLSFESMNIAALWSLTVLFLCENNSPGAGGAGDYPSSVIAAKKLTHIPESLGIPAQMVDGADVEAVYSAVSEAVARMRDGAGPFFIEAITERWPGSRPLWPELRTGVTDLTRAWDETKITGEYADWIRNHDPVLRYARHLLAGSHLKQKDVLAQDKRINDQMETARSVAIASPLPQPESALKGVFA